MCDKQISTDAGTLTCDRPTDHKTAHHVSFAGGIVAFPDQRKSPVPTAITNDRGDFLQAHHVDAFEIEWPHEGMHGSAETKITPGKAGR